MLHLYLALDGREPESAVQALWEQAPRPTSRWRRPRACVWLSGALARPFVFGPVQGFKGWREAHVAAAALAPGACGVLSPCVAFLESDPGIGPALGTAVEASLVEALGRGARKHGWRLASVRPAWALACEPGEVRAAGATELLCVREPDAVTVLAAGSDHISFAATYAPPPNEDDLRSILGRLTSSLGVRDEHFALADMRAERPAEEPSVRWRSGLSEQPA